MTSGKFTQEARDFAGKEKITLIDGPELVGKITALLPEKALALLKVATQGDYQTPTCPACAIKMITRKSTTHGRTYWGCRNYPGCKHTFFESRKKEAARRRPLGVSHFPREGGRMARGEDHCRRSAGSLSVAHADEF